jgi:competence protein CoiA
MLTAIRRSDHAKVIAAYAQRADAPFFCQSCEREVTLRKGDIKTHHFAHKPPVTCARGRGESEQHLRAKLAIYDGLRREAHVTELEVEKDLGSSIADVYARIAGVPVAIEIQRSNLSVRDINARTLNYHRKGIEVLWVGLPTPELETDKYSPNAWEKWCHAAYYGRVYFWEQSQVLVPIHFDSYMIEVPYTFWHEQGEAHSAGGYDRHSKRWRTPHRGIPVLISNSFQPKHRPAYSSDTIVVPDCRLYIDRQPSWWEKRPAKKLIGR